MLLRLFMAALVLVDPADHTTHARLFNAVLQVRDVAFDPAEPQLFAGVDGRLKTALLLLSIAHRESRWNPAASTPQGDVGIMQTRALWWQGHSREELLGSSELGIRIGLRALRHMQRECGGGMQRWLGAWATGKCGGSPQAAREMCAPVGVCAS